MYKTIVDLTADSIGWSRRRDLPASALIGRNGCVTFCLETLIMLITLLSHKSYQCTLTTHLYHDSRITRFSLYFCKCCIIIINSFKWMFFSTLHQLGYYTHSVCALLYIFAEFFILHKKIFAQWTKQPFPSSCLSLNSKINPTNFSGIWDFISHFLGSVPISEL